MTLESLLEQMSDLPTFLGIDLNAATVRGHFGDTPLHVAAVWGDLAAIEILLAHGADVNAAGEHGYTPLHEAVEQEQLEAARLLISRGASTDLKNDVGMTPLHLAEIPPGSVAMQSLLRGS